MNQLLNALFAYSKADLQVESSQSVNIVTVINEIKSQSAAAQNVKLQIENEFNFLHTTPVAITKVLREILTNAFQFNTSDQPLVNVKISKSEGKCMFIVTDNGPGIDSAFHQKIFVMFQTLLSRDQLESMGAGLAIAKKLVEENGGEIGINSALGKGASFWFTWFETEKETVSFPLLPNQLKSVG